MEPRNGSLYDNLVRRTGVLKGLTSLGKVVVLAINRGKLKLETANSPGNFAGNFQSRLVCEGQPFTNEN